jgi:hypothetical protein
MDKEHENWIRYHSFGQARKLDPRKSVDGLIEDAKKIAQYVFNQPKGELVVVAKKKGKGGRKCLTALYNTDNDIWMPDKILVTYDCGMKKQS